jgi:2-dehydro-3-deoxygluconokinase
MARRKSSKSTITVFGEALLRLDVPGNQRFLQADAFTVRYAGAEANVAVALALMGNQASLATVVPPHDLGQACLNSFRRYGVDTRFALRGGSKLGILYVENGASQRPSRTIYDRAGSSFSEIEPAQFDWPEILGESAWLHTSGITPALGEGPRAAQAAALRAAKKQGVKISYDPNYRSTLWSLDEARKVLPKMIEGIDLFLGTAHDAKLLFGIEGDAVTSAQELRRRFGIERVAFTHREIPHASINRLTCLLVDGKGTHESRPYEIHIVDRIGAGDAFAAGIIHGVMAGWTGKRTIEYAAAACALKQSIPGDFGLSTFEEIEELAKTGESGRIRR